MDNKKALLDKEIRKHEVIPVGNGYIDLITKHNMVKLFVSSISDLDIKIVGFIWWCYVCMLNML